MANKGNSDVDRTLDRRRQQLYPFLAHLDYSKQKIGEISNLSLLSVRKSLAGAGMSTKQKMYSGEELLEKYVPFRQLLDSGKTFDEACEIRGTKDARAANRNHSTARPTASAPDVEQIHTNMATFDESVRGAVGAGVSEIVKDAVADTVPQVLGEAAEMLCEMAESGMITQALKMGFANYFQGQTRAALRSANAGSPILGNPDTPNAIDRLLSADIEADALEEEDPSEQP